MADPALPPDASPEGEAPPTKPRSSAPLAAAVFLLLGIPLAGFALKVWGPILFAPEEAPRAVMEVTGARKIEVAGATPVETRGSSIDMVRGDAGTPQPPETAGASQGALAGARGVPPPPASGGGPAPQLAQARDPQNGKKAYPKLKPNHGWTNWFWRQGLPATVDPDPPRQHAAGTEDNIKQLQALTATKPQETASADPPKPGASGVSPASPPAPAKPARQGYKPPAPVYSAADQATQVGPGVGGGTLEAAAGQTQPAGGKRVWTEHSTFASAPDAAPEPNPEKPRTPDGPCPRRGWWKSPYTGYCYYSHAACNASDYEHRGCVQPNP